MKHAAIFLTLFLEPLLMAQEPVNEDAVAILDRIDSLYLSETASSKIRLYVFRPDFQWSYNLEWYSRGRNNAFVRINSPLDYRGRAILKVGKEMWFYNPKEDRVSQMSRAGALRRFLQSEFSRDDFMKINRLSEEYNVNMRQMETTLRLTLTPKMITPIVWDKIVFEVDQETLSPLEKIYFNERGRISKKLVYSKPVEINGKMVPTVLEMTSYQFKNYRSRIEYLDLQLDGPIKPHIFSMKHLKNLLYEEQ
ncbi:outer membrane lipoprotein-sorting protein [Pseudobacteriovorax antillogorgiicola]|uniref:Outer membrane lipoprotein-sorting protein n=1 Tax=Pseudobacteriovorax antillogorgiicola TaxID=1513793 RepID=A0A1Y6BZM2_9BACT|nr:outer membrane lipoprotein-sorting protein [Pseudobacteriovorax antillogorgiicola]TCS51246.1 outer membrane lipoprotein-sorting protein [Pseudobacteriovorax antillogorgiicola]SMF36542.1 outer membrane lipoprotein-sorting protein [Pseudobacteriovorax antillogorgiicola]